MKAAKTSKHDAEWLKIASQPFNSAPLGKMLEAISRLETDPAIGTHLTKRGELLKQQEELEAREQQLKEASRISDPRGWDDLYEVGYISFLPLEYLDVPTGLELLRVQFELLRVRESIRILNCKIARALQEYRSRAPNVSVLSQQEQYFTLHSFHPPHVDSSGECMFGRVGMAA